jgi:hypothetical protein
MIGPNVSLAVFTALALYYLGDCAWRLWRRTPSKYLSVLGELTVAFAIVVGMATALQSAAKVLAIGAFLAATTLRLIARHRFAVHGL